MNARWMGLLALSLCLGAGCSRGEAQTLSPATPPENEVWIPGSQLGQLRMEAVTRRPIPDLLRVAGRVAFDDLEISHVYSPVSGRISRILAEPGQKLAKGAPLAVIVSPDVGSAMSDLVKARADLDAAQHELSRQQDLRSSDASSARDLEAAQDNFRRAQAEYERARERTRLIQPSDLNAVTQEYTLRAPIAGEVISRSANLGVEIQGQYGGGNAPELFTVGELDPVYVLAELHEQELAQVHRGQRVQVSVVAYPGRTFDATVDYVSATLDPTLRTAQVRCRVPNPERLLKPEMYATVTVPLQRDPELAVPRSAVVHLGEQTVVYVALGQTPDGRTRFERRPVHVDEDVTGDLYPVKDGLREGETVVVDGALLLTQVSGA